MAGSVESNSFEDFLSEANAITNALPDRIDSNPDNAAKGIVQLVMALVDLIRELMERQALRRIEAGSLSEEQIERVGLTFMKMEEKLQEIKDHFGLTDDDLNLDLGPLGRLK